MASSVHALVRETRDSDHQGRQAGTFSRIADISFMPDPKDPETQQSPHMFQTDA